MGLTPNIFHHSTFHVGQVFRFHDPQRDNCFGYYVLEAGDPHVNFSGKKAGEEPPPAETPAEPPATYANVADLMQCTNFLYKVTDGLDVGRKDLSELLDNCKIFGVLFSAKPEREFTAVLLNPYMRNP